MTFKSAAAAASFSCKASISEVEFKVKHLMISTVTGKFSSYSGDIESSNEDFTEAKISFTADVKSISTGNEQRDGHLQSDDFFNSESFPQIKFISTGMGKNKLVGDLTIRDVTKSVELNVEYNGKMNDPYGNTKAGFEVSGKINRSDFDLKWSATTEAGGIVVSDEVKIICNIQLIKLA
ncbi:MAG: YceI family protein [Crocinitomicaceae bacterium]|nr:YceI family protein [Crocinitomicaceae bacterium]